MDAGVVVDFLEEMHFDENVGVDCEVGPVDVPVACLVAILDLPVEFFGHLDHHWVLRHFIRRDVLETLITILFIVLNLSSLSTFGLRIYTFSSSLSSSDSSSLVSSSSLCLPINKII